MKTYPLILLLPIMLLHQSLFGQSPYLDSLKVILQNHTSEDTTRLNNLLLLSSDYIDAGNDTTSIIYSREALQLSEKLLKKAKATGSKAYIDKCNIHKATSLRNIAMFHDNNENYHEALKNYYAAINIYNQVDEKVKAASTYNNCAIILAKQGNYPEALEKFYSALKLKEATKDKKGTANSLNNIGNIFDREGNYPEAIKNFISALKIFEELGNKKGIASSNVNIGNIYFKQKNYDEAIKKYTGAKDMFQEIENKSGVAYAAFNIASVYNDQGKYNDALQTHLALLPVLEDLKDQGGIASSYTNIGKEYSELEKYSESVRWHLKALPLYQELDDKEGIVFTYNAIAKTYLNEGKYNDAIGSYNQALQLSKEINLKNEIKTSYSGLAETYQKLEDYKIAYQYATLYSDLKDSLLNETNSKQITEMQTKYETEKKDKEIALLNKDKSIQELSLKEQEAQLKQQILLASKKENEIMILNQFKEIQNLELSKREGELKQQRLLAEANEKQMQLLNKDKLIQSATIEKQNTTRNYMLGGFGLIAAFSGISVFFFNQRRKTKLMQQISDVEMKALRAQMNPHFIFNSLNSVYRYMQEHDFKSASDYLINFSKLIRLILENSLHKEISLNEELSALDLFLSFEKARLHNKFDYKIEVSREIDKENTLIPPLILQPFIENSIWHGFMNKEGTDGKITLRIGKQDDMLKCTIEDNGIGRQRASEIKSRTETSDKKSSVGMHLTNERISIINRIKKSKAYVNVIDLVNDMKQPEGVKVELYLPLELSY